MNTAFETSDMPTVEWYTPPEIIAALGSFDLDPCTSDIAWQLNRSAKSYYTLQDDGLSKEWWLSGKTMNEYFRKDTQAKLFI